MINQNYELSSEECERIRSVSTSEKDNIFRLLKFYQHFNMLYKSLMEMGKNITAEYDEQEELLKYTNFTYIDIYFGEIIDNLLNNNIEECSELVVKSISNCINYQEKIKRAYDKNFEVIEGDFEEFILLLQNKLKELLSKKVQYNNKIIKIGELQQETYNNLKQYYIFANKYNILLLNKIINESDIIRKYVKLLSYNEIVDLY